MALFLGPACLLLAFFFLAPVIVNVVLAFTDMGRNLKITEFTPRTSNGCCPAIAACRACCW